MVNFIHEHQIVLLLVLFVGVLLWAFGPARHRRRRKDIPRHMEKRPPDEGY